MNNFIELFAHFKSFYSGQTKHNETERYKSKRYKRVRMTKAQCVNYTSD
jgi:hypothetical protein